MGEAPAMAQDAQFEHSVPIRVLKKVSVLIVDDDPDTRDLLCAVLEKEGYSCATAGDGSEALGLMHSILPEMILLDIQMPVMDGEHFREAQRRDRDLIRIPTAVMTGSKEEPTLDVGVVATLVKPFRRRELLALVERLCSRAQ
jgi:CheY-like chemotaxis protein